ncbi:MAG: J domain-containing protein [Bacteroidetes bacterium]|nr:J domain-containing protein [Bacteroidota bacterium]
MKDYYYILGIERTSTKEEIKTAYRKLSQKFHPDKNDGDKFFEDRFKDIKEAYETLMDDAARTSYDSLLTGPSASSTYQEEPAPGAEEGTDQPQTYYIGLWITLGLTALLALLFYLRSIPRTAAGVRPDPPETAATPPATADSTMADTLVATAHHQNKATEAAHPAPMQDTGTSAGSNATADRGQSKEATTSWILDKLGRYSRETYSSSSPATYLGGGITSSGWSKYNTNFRYSFNDYYLVIRYQEKYTDKYETSYTDKIAMVPVAEMEEMQNGLDQITFITKRWSIIVYDSLPPTPEKTSVTAKFAIEFKLEAETDIGERLNRAFMHLKQFYTVPPNKEAF